MAVGGAEVDGSAGNVAKQWKMGWSHMGEDGRWGGTTWVRKQQGKEAGMGQ